MLRLFLLHLGPDAHWIKIVATAHALSYKTHILQCISVCQM